MWALRRTSIPLRTKIHRSLVTCINITEAPRNTRVILMPAAASSSPWSRSLCSHAGAKSSDDEDLDEGFSDLEEPIAKELVVSDDESGEAADEGSGLTRAEKREQWRKAMAESPLFKVMMDTREQVAAVLNKWVEEGNPIGRDEIVPALYNLRRRRVFGKALQFTEWLADNKRMDFEEQDYSSHLDLIAKVRGLYAAEKFIEKIPESYRGEAVYRTLLANAVLKGHRGKAEEIFSKIRDAGFATSAYVYNHLLLLYKRTDPKKIADVLTLMEKEKVEPSSFTYKLLLDAKGRSKDISGMEEIVERMKSKGIVIDPATKATIARHYIYAHHTKKAEAVLKEIEGEGIENSNSRSFLLPLYSSLGKVDDVERVWKACEANPRLEECVSAIQAFGDIGNVEKAEEVFELMLTTWKSLSSKYYNVLLKVYANHKLLTKGKEFAKRMENDGCKIGPLTWDALVKLYVGAGEVEKADSVIQNAVEETKLKPLYTSYITLMEKYAQRGDVHNAEKIFSKLKKAGYVGRMKQYQTLVEAYVKAKVPAYGFRERMKADKMVPNRYLTTQLNAIDAFKKSQISELLD